MTTSAINIDGTSPEVIREYRSMILAILESSAEEKTKRQALTTAASMMKCVVSINNCDFRGDFDKVDTRVEKDV